MENVDAKMGEALLFLIFLCNTRGEIFTRIPSVLYVPYP
jgi:hypothetical protein